MRSRRKFKGSAHCVMMDLKCLAFEVKNNPNWFDDQIDVVDTKKLLGSISYGGIISFSRKNDADSFHMGFMSMISLHEPFSTNTRLSEVAAQGHITQPMAVSVDRNGIEVRFLSIMKGQTNTSFFSHPSRHSFGANDINDIHAFVLGAKMGMYFLHHLFEMPIDHKLVEERFSIKKRSYSRDKQIVEVLNKELRDPFKVVRKKKTKA